MFDLTKVVTSEFCGSGASFLLISQSVQHLVLIQKGLWLSKNCACIHKISVHRDSPGNEARIVPGLSYQSLLGLGTLEIVLIQHNGLFCNMLCSYCVYQFAGFEFFN